jgi:hypothetical protein
LFAFAVLGLGARAADQIVQNRLQGGLVVLLQAHRRTLGAGPVGSIGQQLDQGFNRRRDCVDRHDEASWSLVYHAQLALASRLVHEFSRALGFDGRLRHAFAGFGEYQNFLGEADEA